MYMVQVIDNTPGVKARLSGVGKTVQDAVREIVSHFDPLGIHFTHDSVWVFEFCHKEKRFKPVTGEQFSNMLALIRDTFEQLSS